jgi:hypothetical protein
MKKLLLLIVLMIYNFYCLAGEMAVKWQMYELTFQAKVKSDDPFSVLFGAEFTHESGGSIQIPGFYNDDNEWLIRFCPPEKGLWSYRTFSSETKLSGQKGELKVAANENPNVHGPVVISPEDPRLFEYADGSPYFLMAFELDWLFALDWNNEGGIPKTEKIIEEVATNKFNHIVMNVYAYDAAWGEKDKIDPKYNFSRPQVFPFGGTNENPDYSTLNIDFFKHLDRVIAHLNQKDIIAHLMIYVWNKFVNWPAPDSYADNMYFDYVVKRYQAYPNLVWDISKEALAYGRDDMSYVTRRIERLRRLDGHDRLVSVHDYNYCAAFPDKVDFISIQEWRPNLYNSMLEVRDRHPEKPIFNIEHGGYEKTMHSIFDGAYNDPLTSLDRNYQCAFSGTYSTYYWQNSSWYEVVYEPFSLPEENQPNFDYYKHFVTLFEAYPFAQLKPYQRTFTPMTLTDHKSVYLYYVGRDMLTVAGEAPELRGKKVHIRWFNPLTGIFTDGGSKDFGDGVWLGIRKPDSLKSPICVAILEVEE